MINLFVLTILVFTTWGEAWRSHQVDNCNLNNYNWTLSTSWKCQPGLTGCSHWSIITAVLVTVDRATDDYTELQSFVSQTVSSCISSPPSSDIREFLPKFTSKQGAVDDSFVNDLISHISHDNTYVTPDQMPRGLTHLLDRIVNETKPPLQAKGVLYFFTDLNCNSICSVFPEIHSFVEAMYAKNYSITVFIRQDNQEHENGDCQAFLKQMSVKFAYGGLTADGSRYEICPGPENITKPTKTSPKGTTLPPAFLFSTTPLANESTDLISTASTAISTTPEHWAENDGLSKAELALLIIIPILLLLLIAGFCIKLFLKYRSKRRKRKQAVANLVSTNSQIVRLENKKEQSFASLGKAQAFNEYTDISKLSKVVGPDGWEISSTNLMVHENEILGTGAFSNVYKGKLIGSIPLLKMQTGMGVLSNALLTQRAEGHCEVAVKRLPPHADAQNVVDFFHEIAFMKRLGYHLHVICMLGCVTDPQNPLIAFEYCDHGDLLNFLRKNRRDVKLGTPQSSHAKLALSVKNLVSIAWQISDGISYLHANNFVHRDIAARNILLTKNMVAKVSDFGLCRYTDSALYTSKGGKLPIKWMAIESLKFCEFSPKSDMWSFGVCLWEVFSHGDSPFPGLQPLDMLDYLETGNRLPQSDKCPNEIYALLKYCWKEDLDERFTIDEIRARLMTMLDMNDENYGYLSIT